MAIKIGVQYNGGLLPYIILMTQGYYNRETRLNTLLHCFCFVFAFCLVSLHGDKCIV